jgi:hypothetical protein
MSEAEILAARDWADEEADEVGLLPFPDEAAVLLRRAELLLAGNKLEGEKSKPLADLLARIEGARSGETDDLAELLDTLEDLLFDLDLD